jgi:hypothetical protein
MSPQFYPLGGSGLVYGELYEETVDSPRNEVITTGGTYQGWKNATAGPFNRLTSNTSDAVADNLVVPLGGAGDYRINANAILSPGTAASQEIRLVVFVNSTKQDKTISPIRVEGITNIGSLGGSWFIRLEDGDAVALGWTSTNDGDVIQIGRVSLTVARFGPGNVQ